MSLLHSILLFFPFLVGILGHPLAANSAAEEGYIDKLIELKVPISAAAESDDLNPSAVQYGISQELLDTFRIYSEYCAAAYCNPQQGKPGGKVRCGSDDTCPTVEALDTKIYGTWVGEAIDGAGPTGYVAADHTNQNVVLTLRGSVSLANWITDFKWDQKECYQDIIPGAMCEIGSLEFWEQCKPDALPAIQAAMADNPGYPLVITGHSLGGAGAIYAAIELRQTYPNTVLYTFGQNRMSNDVLSQYVTDQGNNYRVTHTNDAIPKLPPERLFSAITGVYTHISPEYWISEGEGNNASAYRVVQGLSSDQGNAGTGAIPYNIIAHIQYFQTNMYHCVLPLPLGILGGEGT